MRLLPKEALIKTNRLDQPGWNYEGILGFIQRRRFSMAVRLLGPQSYSRLLEVGYGSGIFMPELSAHCTSLHGIDTHDKSAAVAAILAEQGVTARLLVASVSHLPFDRGSFDAIVVVSSLEFVDDIEVATAEMSRVLRPGGVAVVITPGSNPILDAGLKVLTGEQAEDTFQGRRQHVIPALRRSFVVDKQERFPPAPSLWLYTGVRLRTRGAS